MKSTVRDRHPVVRRRVVRGRRACVHALAFAVACASTIVPFPSLAAEPVSVTDDRGVRVVLDAPPERIVSLLPSLTETLCALGACERLVGVDRFSDWPASVAALPDLGGFEDVRVERLFALRPDVVLVAESARVIDRLESLGLTVVAIEPRSLADVRRAAERLAALLARPDEADALIARIDAGIAAAAARVPPAWRGARAYFEVSEAPYAAGESSFIGELLAALGIDNIVPASLGPFPKLNPEYVVRARPELILGAARTLDGMDERPGWDAIVALGRGHVCAFETADHDVLVRPGPRLAEAAGVLADCVAGLPPRGGGAE